MLPPTSYDNRAVPAALPFIRYFAYTAAAQLHGRTGGVVTPPYNTLRGVAFNDH